MLLLVPLNYCLPYLKCFDLQCRGVPIAISSLGVLFTVSVVKVVLKANGDDAMRSKRNCEYEFGYFIYYER